MGAHGVEMKINPDDFRVKEGGKVTLKEWPTAVDRAYKSKKDYAKLLADDAEKLSALQSLHYACNKYAVLLIFQGMDAAGKDGAIRYVMSGVDPQGCQVSSFKHPTAVELRHDFLWRTTLVLPERGQIGIFNRSYYEEVLIARVHPEILLGEGLPDAAHGGPAVWRQRFRSILDLEAHLHRNGTRVTKFFLHVSKDEQRKRFLDRIDDPRKNWKFTAADFQERAYWDDYMAAYEDCLETTSTAEAPWYIVPADDKLNTRLIVSSVIQQRIEGLGMSYPKTSPEQLEELQAIRRQLAG